MNLLIKNGRVIDPSSGTDETLDILIDKGKIVEQGTHQDLIEKKGLYRYFYEMQFKDPYINE